MPRKLPWLAEAAAKKETARAAAKPTPTTAARSSSPGDLVGSDLEDLNDDDPARSPRPKKKKVYRAPSSSPPPVVKEPPPTILMNPGYTADDKWMMVEDEFYSTAQLWTQHLHQQEYARLKKLHRSRGQDTLDSLARGTDGRTKQSKQVQLKIQADDMAKKRMMVMGAESGDEEEEEEEEDDFMFDPQLAGLMTGSSQRNAAPPSKLVRTKSRLAMAEDGDESSEPLPKPDLSAVEEEQEQEDEEETDSDDLDAPKPKPPTKAERKLLNPFASSSSGPKQSPPRIFRQFARSSIERRRPLKGDSPPSSPPPRLPAPVRERPKPSRSLPSLAKEPTFEQITAKQRRSPSPVAKPPVTVKDENGPRASSFLAKRRAQKEKEAAEARRKEIEDSIPAFFF